MKTCFAVLFSFCLHCLVQAQSLTLENIFLHNQYREKRPDNLRFQKDDRFYTEQEGTSILLKETLSGKTHDTLIHHTDTLNKRSFQLFDYAFSDDESFLLLAGNRKNIYRRSYTADYCLIHLPTHTTQALLPKCSYATLSPDGSKVAYVRDNNLFYYDIAQKKEVAVTTDGRKNFIINGSTDWVYEEEFEFTQAFFWSPDNKYLAYYRFDETEVPEYNMQKWAGNYPIDYRFKYPKAGEKNAKVAILIRNIASQATTLVPMHDRHDFYIPKIAWTPLAHTIAIRKLDRSQTKLTYYHFHAAANQLDSLFEIDNQQQRPIEMHNDDFQYTEGKKKCILFGMEDSSGLRKPALYDIRSKKIGRQHKGLALPGEIASIDQVTNGRVWDYYTCYENAIGKSCYVVSRKTLGIRKISRTKGTHAIQVSEAGNYYLLTHSSAGIPSTVTLFDAKTQLPLRTLEDNAPLRAELDKLQLPKQTFFSFKTSENITLNGWMIKPSHFDSTQHYPVIQYVYGGPGSQMVVDTWTGSTYLWHQYLASQGFIVACVDGRGTGGRGTEFRTCTYKKLGELETKDQIETAKYLGSLPYVDKNRIGIWGWSFGGYLSTNSLFWGSDVFKAAIAVAPVTNWRFYDSIYTERYLSTPQDNAVGYDRNSPIHYADKLKGHYLLIHGTSDDNVHFQNTLALQEALIKAGKQFETFVYPNKAHGISGGNTRWHLYTLMTNFWKANL